MSKKVTIPTDGGNPFVVMHNGIKYVYKPGADVDVPDGVALEIEEYKRWRKKYPCEVVPPFGVGGGSGEGSGGGTSVQPDLAQNDPTAPDYVKNRTHYEETSFRNVGYKVGTDFQENADLGFLYTGRCPFGVEPIENVQYKVTFGETVLGPALCRANKNCDYGTCIGNAYLYGLFVHRNSTKTKEELESEGYTDTKEDFVYVPHQYFITTNPNVKAGQSYLVLLYEGTTTIKTLDPKYLPDSVPYEKTEVVNEPLNITWDGNTEGLVRVLDCFFKISDLILTDEQIKSATTRNNVNEIFVISEYWDDCVEEGAVTEDVVDVPWCVFVRKAGVQYGGGVFPEVGIYAFSDDGYLTSLTTTEPVEHTKTIVKKLDKKFLPAADSNEIVITGEMTDDGWYEYSCNVPYTEARNAIENGSAARLLRIIDNGNSYITFKHLNLIEVVCYSQRMIFVFYNPVEGTQIRVAYDQYGNLGGGDE